MKQFLLLLVLFSSLKVAAQVTQKMVIKGMVVDSANHQPLGFATVTLLNGNTAVAVNSTLTKDDGKFEIYAVAGRQYRVSAGYIGYKPVTVILPAGNTNTDLGKIALSSLPGQLKEVSIKGKKPMLKQEIDRVSYDVQADPESKANDALEMLKKVPMITVDGSDNIQLKGSSSYRIFINGQPSALMANDPAEVLRSMPAATILKIEVITIPPSKYDGEGLAGIINIITLKKTDDGINGSVFARYNNNLGERGSISLAAKKGKFGINTFFGLGYQKNISLPAGSQLTTFSPETNLIQQGDFINSGKLNNGQVQLSYEADSLSLFTASLDFADRNFTQSNTRYTQLFVAPDSLAQAYQSYNDGYISNKSFDFGANYQLGFRQDKNELLTISYQYLSATHNQHNDITATERINYSNADYDQQNNTGSTENTFQLDFVKPFKLLTVEAGAKAIFRNNSSDFEEENQGPASGLSIPDTSLSNQFTYHQNVYSLYNTYQLKLTNWIFKGGVRAENTDIGGSLLNDNIVVNQHYLNLIPAVSVQHSYPGMGTFTFGFTERTERPVINELNPFTDRSNPDFIVTGNPDLRPVLNHVFELDYSRFTKLAVNVSLNYAFASNTIQSVTSLINDTLSKTTYLNTGTSRSGGLDLSLNYPFTDRLQVNMNGQLSHLWLTGTFNNVYYKSDGTQGNVFGSAAYKLGGDYRVSAGLFYNGANVYLQGKSNTYFSSTYVISKDFLNKRATLSLTIYDPYKRYSTGSSYSRTPDFYQSSFNEYYYRSFRVGFNYKFGKLKNDIKTNKRGIRNDDVKSTGSDNQ